jgi:hypothetical protein
MRIPKVGDRVRIKPNNRTYPSTMWGKVGTVVEANVSSFRFDVLNQWGYPCSLGVGNIDHYEFVTNEQMLIQFGKEHV